MDSPVKHKDIAVGSAGERDSGVQHMKQHHRVPHDPQCQSVGDHGAGRCPVKSCIGVLVKPLVGQDAHRGCRLVRTAPRGGVFLVSRIRALTVLTACLTLACGSLMAHDPHDPIEVVAISPNYAQDHTVLVATSQLTLKLGVILLLKSTDGGVNWTAVGLPNNSNICSVVFSPAYGKDQTVFVAGAGGLFSSTDGANSWTSLSASFLVSLALSPNFANDNMLFVVTNQNKIYRSANRGKTLTLVSSPPLLTSPLRIIAVSPNFTVDYTLLLGSQADGIFKSFNAGNSWSPVAVGALIPIVTALAFSPSFSSDRLAFAGTLGSGFLVSTNGGNTWLQSNTGLTDTNVSSLALSPTYAQDSTLWVTTAVGGVFQSTTSGASWGLPVSVPRALSDLTTVHYQTIAASPAIQFLGMFEGLWTSGNSGVSWQYIDTCPTRIVRYINMSPDYPKDQTIFASTYGSGNLWSTDGGSSWKLQNTGMQAPYTDGSAISPNFAADGIAFSGNHRGLQRTSDRGTTWQMMPGPGVVAYPRGLAVSPNFAQDKTVYIGTTSVSGHNAAQSGHNSNLTPGLYISTDAGKDWTISSLSGEGIISIAFSPAFATDQTAFAGSQAGTLYKTTNDARTWTALTLPGAPNGIAVVAVSPNFAVDQVVFAAAIQGGIYKSGNGGVNWTSLPNTRTIRGLDIKFSPNYAVDQTLFIGTIQYGLMQSTNGGRTLSPVTSFPDVFVTAVGVSAGFQNDHTLYAAGYHGLFKSTNGGSTWTYLVTPARIEESRNVASSLQEPPTITYQGTWSMITPSTISSTDQYAATPDSQDTATLDFLGTGVRWVSWTGPLQGSASIQLDGISLGTVSLTGQIDQFQQTVWEQHGIPCGNHTFRITASPQVTQSVSLDAFDVWVDNCPYAIYDNTAMLGANSTKVGAAAGSGSVLLTTNGLWTAYSNAPWLSLSSSSASGSGSTPIQFSYTANSNPNPLIGTLTIAGLTFTVTQAGAGSVPVDPVASDSAANDPFGSGNSTGVAARSLMFTPTAPASIVVDKPTVRGT